MPAQDGSPRTDIPKDPYYDVQFDAFIKEIGNANLSNWTMLAEALGVHPETIRRWKEHPLAKQAIANAIEENLRKMTEVGSNDWKMYWQKLKMLGVKDKTTVEHEAGEGVSDILDKLSTDYGKLADQARSASSGQVVADDAPVQNPE